MPAKADGITVAEAAHILAGSTSLVYRHVLAGRLTAGPRYQHRRFSRAEVEALACEVLVLSRLRERSGSYFVIGRDAAEVLGASTNRLGQLSRRGALPFLVHHTGVRLFRRHQLAVIGNARLSRRLR